MKHVPFEIFPFAAGAALCFLAFRFVLPCGAGRRGAGPPPEATDAELVDLTWRAFVKDDGLERWRASYRRVAGNGKTPGFLADVRLDEIERSGGEAFVAWRLVEFPEQDEGDFIRETFRVDARTREIVGRGSEIHENR